MRARQPATGNRRACNCKTGFYHKHKDAKKFLIIECARQVVRIPFQNEVDIFRSRKERGGEKMRDLKEAVTNEFISNVSVK